MSFFDSGISPGHFALLVLALVIVLAFEFVNGFHDTANAVATVIYTRSLRPHVAVVLSGFFNFCGVYLGGLAVAMSILKLLPVELLATGGSGTILAMVFSLLLAAILWNLGTWYLGLPSSSSHTLIGAIVGVGIVNSMRPGHVFGEGVNWRKVEEVGLSLVISPMFGLALAAALLLVLRKLLPTPRLHAPVDPSSKPPGWVRLLLVGTSSGVSFAHGSNDGQKGVGLVMLILIGLLPADFALNTGAERDRIAQVVAATETIEAKLPELGAIEGDLASVRAALRDKTSIREIPPQVRWEVRSQIQRIDDELATRQGASPALSLEGERRSLKALTEYAPPWVLLAVALSLGIGTMVGWRRIVVTIGEKIGKSHMSYSQGAAGELVAASTIAASASLGLPVSTTHVLSSGIAGTMLAQKVGLQRATVRNIALAWVLTVPVSMVLAGGLFFVLRSVIPESPRAVAQPAAESVEPTDALQATAPPPSMARIESTADRAVR